MERTLLLAVLTRACVGARYLGQPPADCRPNALNIPSAPFLCIVPGNDVIFRVAAPDAHEVTAGLGRGFDMAGGSDGLRYATTPPQVAGFHYCFESPGTAHEWLTWRRCFNDFAPRLFR